MNSKLKKLFIAMIIVIIIIVSRFTTLSDFIKTQVSSFLTPVVATQVEINGLTPFRSAKIEIENELQIIRNKTNADGVGLVIFHDNKQNLTTLDAPGNNLFFTVLFEVVGQGHVSTAGSINDIPATSIFESKIKTVAGCSGWEFGGELTPEIFKNLPPRPLITCAIRYNNNIVGVVYIVDAYRNRSLEELVGLIPTLQELAGKINKIISK